MLLKHSGKTTLPPTIYVMYIVGYHTVSQVDFWMVSNSSILKSEIHVHESVLSAEHFIAGRNKFLMVNFFNME